MRKQSKRGPHTQYDVIIWNDNKTIVGTAQHSEKDGVISVNLYLVPLDGQLYLRPKS
jgi:hypothetical protein